MKIFADKNILAVESNFSRHGELHFFDGRTVCHADLLEADVLLVRSITRVDRSLLEGTKIRFVGTATSGIDHIDTDYLHEAGIHLANAKGCNANAVVDYCFTALAFAAMHRDFEFGGCRVGIVGAGAVGGLFATKLENLGVQVRCYDPLLAQSDSGEREYFPLEAVLECDAVSLHVPLSLKGPFPTSRLLSARELAALKSNAVLINACRGGVVDERALHDLLARRNDIVTVFDVWAGEPSIDASLAALVDIATPHIAGYSKEAKSNATSILACAVAEHFELEVGEQGEPVLNAVALAFDVEPEPQQEWSALLGAFPLNELSTQFKRALSEGSGVEAFDSFRQLLLQRREFESRQLRSGNYSPEQRQRLSILGFRFD